MPIYEYRCQECGCELEKLQRMSDAPLVDCPACKRPALRRLISAAGFRLKGAGWYETDFKQGQKKNLAESGEKADKDTDAKKAEKKTGDGKSEPAKSGGEPASKSGKETGAAPSAGAA